MYSPQSHQLAVGSKVSMYTVVAMANTNHPVRSFSFLKFMLSNIYQNKFEGSGY
jgi:hypothetical protein